MAIKLDTKTISYLANLCRLKLSKNEAKVFSKQLEDVLVHFEEMSKIDTSAILPTSQTTGQINITRKDEINFQDVLNVDDALFNAKDKKNNLFKVALLIKK